MSQDRERPARSVEQILDERARALSRPLEDRRTAADGHTCVVVRVGTERLGFPVSCLDKVVRRPVLAELLDAPPHFAGLASVTGSVVAVVDPCRLLGISSDEPMRLLLVIESPRGGLGLLIHALEGFRQVHDDELVDRHALSDARRARIGSAMTKDLLLLVSPEALEAMADPGSFESRAP